MPNIFEQITGVAPKDNGETIIGPWWCESGDGECFEVEDEALLYEDGFVYWTCEQGHKNKVKLNIG